MIVLMSIVTVLLGSVILFQIALVAGMPWGSLAMGGKFPGKFPPALRISAVVQALVLLLALMIIYVRAGIVFPEWFGVSQAAIWFVVALFAISTVLNWITPSKWERRIWGPTVSIILLISLYVAFS